LRAAEANLLSATVVLQAADRPELVDAVARLHLVVGEARRSAEELGVVA
jgi:hypothetical protein